MSDLFQEKLNWFKRNERPEALLAVADDPELARLAAAWTFTAVRPKRTRSTLKGETPCEIWNWLWENVEFSCEELIESSGVHAFTSREQIVRLIANRVIYPDGTVNSYVRRYLRKRALGLLDAKPKKHAARSHE
jgi:hypothetical protein